MRLQTGIWKLNGPPVKLVGNFSAKSGRLRDRESHQLNPINRNHSDLVKFPLYDDVYETVCSTLRDFAAIAPKVVYARFNLQPAMRLHKAAEKGDSTRTHLLLSCGADPNEADSEMMTPMHIAAQHGKVEVIQTLIKHGANMSEEAGQHQRTPLHCAVLEGHLAAVRVLVENGANVDAIGRYGDTSLHSAAVLGHAEIVRTLVQYGARVNGSSLKDSNTALHFALEAEIMKRCPGEKNEALDTLVALGANVNARLEGDQLTPLHWAVRAGNFRAARMFLSAGADVNAIEAAESRSPLHESVLRGNAELTCLLLDNGAAINSRDMKGRTPLFIAAERGESAVISELFRYDPDIEIRDHEHKLTPLEIAKRNEHWTTLQLLEGSLSPSLSLASTVKEEDQTPYGKRVPSFVIGASSCICS